MDVSGDFIDSNFHCTHGMHPPLCFQGEESSGSMKQPLLDGSAIHIFLHRFCLLCHALPFLHLLIGGLR